MKLSVVVWHMKTLKYKRVRELTKLDRLETR